jgi:hypothetical protein
MSKSVENLPVLPEKSVQVPSLTAMSSDFRNFRVNCSVEILPPFDLIALRLPVSFIKNNCYNKGRKEFFVNKTLDSLMYLTEFSDDDRRVLQEAAKHTQLWVDQFVQMFYDTLFAYPLTSCIFHEGERPEREQTIRDWYLRITSGELDDNFWEDQWRVGLPHINRQVLNSYMFGMMHRTQKFFLDKCLADFGTEKGLRIYHAFKRASDIASGLIAEGYHSTYAVIKAPH